MTDKKEISGFFDKKAENWDSSIRKRTTEVIKIILDRARICPGYSVLDVGAGTGVLLPFLFNCGIADYTGLELSRGMINVFKKKHPAYKIILGDFEEELDLNGKYDLIILFNTFAHFPKPEKVFSNGFFYLKPGGSLVISHCRTREEIIAWHRDMNISIHMEELPSDKTLLKWCNNNNFKDIVIDDTDYFYFSARKPE